MSSGLNVKCIPRRIEKKQKKLNEETSEDLINKYTKQNDVTNE